MSERKIKFGCPHCKEEVVATVPLPDPITTGVAGAVRASMQPRDTIYEYRITSSQIKEFCAGKLEYYSPGSTLTVLPAPVEKSKKTGHVGFAAMHLAFSSDIVENNHNSFLDRVGIDPNNVRIVRDVWVNLIKDWMIDVNELKDIRKDYRRLEELKTRFNITDSYLEWLIVYGTPKKVPMDAGNELIVMAARADAILMNMLEEVEIDGQTNNSGEFRGSMKIISADKIDDSNMEFIVHVSRNPVDVDVKPEVLAMMRENRPR